MKPRSNSKDLIEKEEERINQALADMWKKGKIREVLKDELKSQGG